jgi:hypothetical protein
MEISLSMCENTTLTLEEAGRGGGMQLYDEEFLVRGSLVTVVS